MQITYNGRHTEGVFVSIEGGEVFVAHGGTAEVPDDVATRLLDEQPDAFTTTVSKKAVAKAEEAES